MNQNYTISTENILKALQAGESPDAIATAFTMALNDAVKQQKTASAAEKERREKITRMQAILNMTEAYMKDFYPEFGDQKAGPGAEDAEHIVESIDKAYREMKSIATMFDHLAPKVAPTPKAARTEDSLTNFLKANGLA
jgi:hypothetical protein